MLTSVEDRGFGRAWLAVALVVGIAYALFATHFLGRARMAVGGGGIGAYDALAESFLHGRLDLSNPYADPRLRELGPDLSVKDGTFHLYWGPLPALLLYAPFRAITGSAFDDRAATFFFMFGAWAFGSACIVTIWRRHHASLPAAAPLCAMVALAAGNLAFYLLRRSRIYEVCVAAGICFFVAGLYRLLSWAGRRDSRRDLVLAGLFFGACVTTRPIHAVAVLLIVAATGIALLREKRRRDLAALLGPLALCVLLMGVYNAARFGSMVETGFGLQGNGLQDKGLHPWALGRNLYLLLLRAPAFSATPPFIVDQGADEISRALAPGHSGYIHNMVSLFWLVPYAMILSLLLPRTWSWLKAPRPPAFEGTLLALGFLGTLSVLLFYPYADLRYTADYLSPAILLAATEWFAFLGAAPSPRRWTAMAVLAAATAAMGVMVALL